MFKKKERNEENELVIWREDAFQRQSYYCDMLGDRDWERYNYYDCSDFINLTNKIGFALFGSPKNKESADQQDDNETPAPMKSDSPSRAEPSDVLDTEKNIESISKFISLFNLETPPEVMMMSSPDDSDEDDEQQPEESVSHNPTDNLDKYEIYYNDNEQFKQIQDLIKKIEICSNDKTEMYVAFIFVIAKIDTFIAEFPIIRVRNKMSANFIDPTGRCYKSWNDFLKDNFFPKCEYCYPTNGFYTYDIQEQVMVEFSKSPEAGFMRETLKEADVAHSVIGMSCGLIALASLAVPVAGPLLAGSMLVGGSSGLWSAGRATYHLIDRRKHKQDLFDREGRSCWVSMAAGVLGAASMGALSYTTYLARNGKVLGKAANLLVNGVEFSNVGVAGLSILNHSYRMYEDKKVTTLDATELVLSLVFFCNSAIKLKTAKTILIEKQNEVIGGIESQLSRSQKRSFRKLAKSTANGNPAEGNARVIRTVKNLKDPRTYFKQLNSIRKMANKTKSSITFSEDASGRITINGKVSLDPELTNSMTNKSKQKLFISSKKQQQFQKWSCEFRSNGKKLFSAMKISDVKNIDDLFVVMKNDKAYSTTRLLINEELKELKSLNPLELINIILKVYENIGEAKELFHKLMKLYEDKLKDSLEKLVEDITEMFEKKMIEICNEEKVKCTTLNNSFLRPIKGKYFTSWDYFEYCLKKLDYDVPERESVVTVPQKVGWLYLFEHPRVHSMFITGVRLNLEREKITSIAMIKE